MPEGYEEIRRKLVERGYLQGRIERFVLRDLLAATAPHALARTSAKAALLGAPLLGGLLAASMVAANRPLLTGREALLLWLYFAIVAGVALFALDLVAAGLAAAWSRRRGVRSSDAVRAGLIVAVPVLVYLVLLWARGRPEGGFGEDAVFLVGAVAVAALVAWLAGLVSLAGIVGRTGDVPDRNRRGAVLVVAVLVSVAAAFFALRAASFSAASRSVPPSAFSSAPQTTRLLVVGIDGLDGGLVEESSDAAATERLLALIARGALYPKHRETAEPPEVWTTIATGMRASAHGVRQAGATRLPGIATPITAPSGTVALDAALRFLLPARTVPASGAERRVRALWEIVGWARPASTVGWWASWPARGIDGDPRTGYVVSDRVLAKLLSSAREDRDTQPEALFARLARDFPTDRAAWRARFDASFADLPEEARSVAWESFLIDSFAWKTTSRLLDDPAVAVSFTYVPGLDILRSRLGSRNGASRAVRRYVRWLDDSIFADLLDRTGDELVVVGDPGRSATADAEGFVAIVGGGAAPKCIGPAIADLDIAPIVLRLAGLPASREMRGRAPERCFEGAPPALPPIESWGRRGRSTDSPHSDYDPEMVERLKSLGYLR